MNNYTVLLLRPDDCSSNNTYLAHVAACGVSLAIEKAQMEAWVADNGGPDDDTDPEDVSGDPLDYMALFVCLGHVEDLNP